MRIKYEADDGTLFDDREQAEKYEKLSKNMITIEEVTKRKISLVSPAELKNIFEAGEVSFMSFYLRDESGTITYDGSYETYSLDSTGHLECTDYELGLLEWSKKDNSYYKTVRGHSWKVELLGIKSVHYS